jgi:hypothetical protein
MTSRRCWRWRSVSHNQTHAETLNQPCGDPGEERLLHPGRSRRPLPRFSPPRHLAPCNHRHQVGLQGGASQGRAQSRGIKLQSNWDFLLKRLSKRISRWLGCSFAICSGAIFNLVAADPALADLVQWKTNGHYYEVVAAPVGITWIEARQAAQARGGYLTTLTSKPENLFVWSLISGRSNFWTTASHSGKTDAVGPWIGLFQVRHQIQEPDGGWVWVSGEPFSYSNWAPGRPNNLEEIEDYGQYLIVEGSNDQATWNDVPNDSLRLTKVRAMRPVAYIVEYDTKPKR